MTRARGLWAETVAQTFLQHQGLVLLAQNYRCKLGEIDLVMRERDTTVFVEVRYRRRDDFGTGAETVARQKQRKLIATARYYLQTHASARRQPCRFDVVSISSTQDPHAIDWIRNAFEAVE